MVLDFPSSPNANDIYTKDGYTWVFDGTKWTGLEKTSLSESTDSSVSGNLYVGQSAKNQTAVSTNPIIVAKDSGANYVQTAMINSSSTGSADFAAYGDNGTDAAGWVDMGFTGSAFNDTNYGITQANDGYLFTQAASSSFTGNLVLATGGNGSANDIIFGTGGFAAANEKMRLDHATGDLVVGGSVVDHVTTNAQSASYSITTADDGQLIEMNSASANTLTIPLNSSQALPVGSQITILQTGVGQTTIVPTTIITKTYSSGGALGATTFSVLPNGTSIAIGQLVTGTGIAANTYVTNVSSGLVTISQATIAQVAGTITFSIPVFASPGLKLRGQWSSATLIKRTADSKTSANYANDTWVVLGDLTS